VTRHANQHPAVSRLPARKAIAVVAGKRNLAPLAEQSKKFQGLGGTSNSQGADSLTPPSSWPLVRFGD